MVFKVRVISYILLFISVRRRMWQLFMRSDVEQTVLVVVQFMSVDPKFLRNMRFAKKHNKRHPKPKE
ncbi:Hypp3269 [Branchiostoma lanceolatum]|uniref:Hypp3269 protein n=1 Tax=Branchiostoma lanceolatum TaxID=7740 RepID=A0A8J9ZYK0_BRALA|nr:Hypp3269 [Branchiostoma lanceolatum]